MCETTGACHSTSTRPKPAVARKLVTAPGHTPTSDTTPASTSDSSKLDVALTATSLDSSSTSTPSGPSVSDGESDGDALGVGDDFGDDDGDTDGVVAGEEAGSLRDGSTHTGGNSCACPVATTAGAVIRLDAHTVNAATTATPLRPTQLTGASLRQALTCATPKETHKPARRQGELR